MDEAVNVLASLQAQLPATVRLSVAIALRSDPFLFRPVAVFTTSKGVKLEAELVEGRLREEDIARLCVMA